MSQVESPPDHCFSPPTLRASPNDLLNRLPVIHCQPLTARDLQPVRVEAELAEDGGVDIGDVMAVLHRVEAELIGGAVRHAAFDAASREPRRKALRVVIAAVALGARRP